MTVVGDGDRFEFGENWQSFVTLVDRQRIDDAVGELSALVGSSDLAGRRFVDVGCGSGLSSLAARQLGAEVVSFDLDPMSVTATEQLRKTFRPDDPGWEVTTGSVLDRSFLEDLGTFDVVYSWGVLHHTGAMRTALENIAPLVAPDGLLCLALYNDQGIVTRGWKVVKRAYTSGGPARRRLLVGAFLLYFGLRRLIGSVLAEGTPPRRGMSMRHDVVDWVGGWPFEVARPDEVLALYRRHGFVLERLRTVGGRLGNNEYVFSLPSADVPRREG